MTREEWQNAEKKIDPNFKGSIFEQIGWTEYLCPNCNAHLTQSKICLNACHLGDTKKYRFQNELTGEVKR